jgi:RNA polymerase primary sigma factor
MTDGLHYFEGYGQTAFQESPGLQSVVAEAGIWDDASALREEPEDACNLASAADDGWNPLRMYLEEVGSFSLLKKTEEVEAAIGIENGREKAMRAIFSLPFCVEKLIRLADMVKTGNASLADIVRPADVSEGAPEDEEKKFFAAVRQITKIHLQRVLAPSGRPMPLRYKGSYSAHKRTAASGARPTLTGKKLLEKIIALRLREHVVDAVHDELSEALRNVRHTDARKKRYEQTIGATFEEISSALRLYAEAKADIFHAKKILIEGNLRLVVSAARRYQYVGMEGLSYADIIQEGNIGLMKAVERFEPQRGYKFSTYAMYWIKQSITRALSNSSRMIRFPVHIVADVSKIINTSKELMRECGDEPSPEDVAQRVMMPVKKVRALLNISREPLSLNTPIGDADTNFEDFIEDRSIPSPLDNVIRDDLQAKIGMVLSGLDPKEEKIVRGRFGIGGEEQTLATLAQEFGLTRERIRQIEVKALRKIKMQLTAVPS